MAVKFLKLLVERKRAKLVSLDRETKYVKDKLLPFYKDSTNYKSLSSNLQKHLEKEEHEQK